AAGVGELNDRLGALAGGGLGRTREQIEQTGRTAREMGGIFGSLAQAAGGVSGGLSPATGLLGGFGRQGVAASAEGQVLNIQLGQLSHQIASLFAPQIRAVIDHLGGLVTWFQRLSGEQQAQLRQWGLLAAGLTGTAIILPR